MIWKYILHCKLPEGTKISEAAKLARETGYSLLAFNGVIYFVEPYNSKEPSDYMKLHETGILVEDIEK